MGSFVGILQGGCFCHWNRVCMVENDCDWSWCRVRGGGGGGTEPSTGVLCPQEGQVLGPCALLLCARVPKALANWGCLFPLQTLLPADQDSFLWTSAIFKAMSFF